MSHERRKDPQLRESIELLQEDIKSLTSEGAVYLRVLQTVCALTQSPQAFILKREQKRGQHTFTITEACSLQNGVVNTWSVDKVNITRHSEQLLANLFVHKKHRVFQDFELKAFDLSALDFPKIRQMIAIPMSHSNTTLSVLCLCNAPLAYSNEVVRRLWPLIAIGTSMIRILQNHHQLTQGFIDAAKGQDNPLETLSLIESHCPIGMIKLDTSLNIVSTNEIGREIFQFGDEAVMLGLNIQHLIPENYRNEHKTQTFAPVYPLMHQGQPMLLKALTHMGRPILLSLTYITYHENHEKRFLCMFTDRTEFDVLKESFDKESRRFKALADLSPIGILQTDSDWSAVYINDKWCKICQIEATALEGQGWVSIFHEDEVEEILAGLRDAIEQGQEYYRECLFDHTATNTWVELNARAMYNADGEVAGIIATLTDSTYRHKVEAKLRNMAERDALTGLANRALFLDRLSQAVRRIDRHGPIALLCLDLDGFKNVNDSLGHDAGDLLLVEVSKRLTQCVRDEDTVARVGGDEFMILLEGLHDASDASHVAEKVLEVLRPPCKVKHQEVFIGTSIGITFALKDSVSPQTIVKQADIALYRAKSEGRRNYQYYSPELEKASKERLDLGNSLHQALKRAEFEVYYQLQAEVATNRFVGTEALLRWRHAKKGILAPPAFIQLLEETGLIVPVSRWLWYQAFLDHKRWVEKGWLATDSHVSVNLSPRQLRDKHLVTGLAGAMRDAGLTGPQVNVEITESALLDDSPLTTNTLKKIKDLGMLIALDDFGTGYSSLTYLKRYPIDQIKIDKSFVHDIISDADDAAITRALIALAKSLNMNVVAEGVEDVETLQLLAEWGCKHYQGYFLNKPYSAVDLEVLLKEQDKAAD